jgi:hypothetical protein
MPAMARILARTLLTLLLASPATLVAQPAPPPVAGPGAQPVVAPGTDRGTGFDHIVAFAGAALCLLVVCYPARRY